jgi:hypothetical protein
LAIVRFIKGVGLKGFRSFVDDKRIFVILLELLGCFLLVMACL